MSDFDNPPSNDSTAIESEVSDSGPGRPEQVSSPPLPVTALVLSRARGGRPVLTLEKMARLKEMFFAFETFDTIAKTLGMSVKTIARQVNKPRATGLSWAATREEQRRLMAESVMSNSAHLLQQATDRSVRMLHLALAEKHRQLTLDPGSMEIKDIEKIASIAEKLDRLNRLSSGQATSIHTLMPGELVSKEKTEAILKSDPFTTAEFVEVKDEDH